jgi:hypothetical protein
MAPLTEMVSQKGYGNAFGALVLIFPAQSQATQACSGGYDIFSVVPQERFRSFCTSARLYQSFISIH